jgi:hypothetical protein
MFQQTTKVEQLKTQNSLCSTAVTNLAVKGMIGNFWLISLKINLDAFIFK